MKKIKIFTALDHLDTYELNRFEKYVKSPYFNSNSSLISILEEYQTNRKKGKIGYLDKRHLWNTSFGNKAFNDSRMRKALSDLLSLFEDFLYMEHLNSRPLDKISLLMEAVTEKEMSELNNSIIRKAQILSDSAANNSSEFYFHKYQIEKNLYELTDFDIKRNERSNIASIINNLDHFYLAEKLKYYCTSKSRSAFVEHQYEYLFIEEIKQHISEHKYQDVPIVNIWISIFYMQNETETFGDQYFNSFKLTFSEIINSIPQKEAGIIFTYGQNYCIRKLNSGQDQYVQELFELNKVAIEEGILLISGKLDPTLFRNIVAIALRLKEYEWASKFIDSNKTYVHEDFRRNAVGYSRAILSFYRKEHNSVMDHLNSMEILDISYELNSKSLLLMNYFEMEETDVLQSLLDSFYVYLNRHKDLTQNRRDIYLNQISFTKRLMNLAPSDKPGHQKLLDKLNDTKIIGSRAWLKEKILERLN